jgi:uncharacterized protein
MLTLLSPAKKLQPYTQDYNGPMTTPICMAATCELIQLMQSKSVGEIAALMSLSEDLAQLNYDRYQKMPTTSGTLTHAYPAVLLFQGDVYQGLQAKDWDERTLGFASSHLALLSGLYGLLSPMDGIWPYRLEMGVKLPNTRGKNLYDFWRASIAALLNQRLAAQAKPLLLNLASTEYFKAVDVRQINVPVVTVNFYEQRNNQLKMIGFSAKKARGTMARFLMTHAIDDLDGVKAFTELGYRYQQKTSDGHTLNFTRSGEST